MTRTPLLLVLAASAALAGCNKESHTIIAGPDGDNTAPANVANVVLPPSITSSGIYRCKDNSVIYVDWLSDGSARVRAKRTDVGEVVQSGEGQPIQGSAGAKTITYKGQSCNS